MLTNKQLSDLICSAFEGGSNYWIESAERVEPSSWEWESDDPGDHWLSDCPLNPGGAVLITAEDVTTRLDMDALRRGEEVMRLVYPRHWQAVMEDYADGDTGDVFLQCCLFGELVYC